MKTVELGTTFGGYWFSNDGETLFGIRPYHVTHQGMVDGKHLLFCIFYEELLNDGPSGNYQESAEMSCIEADDRVTGTIDLSTLSPYAQQVVGYDRYNGKADEWILENRGYLLCAEYAGKTFADVCTRYPVVYTQITDDEGNVYQQPSHRSNSQEGI